MMKLLAGCSLCVCLIFPVGASENIITFVVDTKPPVYVFQHHDKITMDFLTATSIRLNASSYNGLKLYEPINLSKDDMPYHIAQKLSQSFHENVTIMTINKEGK